MIKESMAGCYSFTTDGRVQLSEGIREPLGRNALLQRTADLNDAAKKLFADAEREGRDLTIAEKNLDDSIHKELEAIQPKLARVTQEHDRERAELEVGLNFKNAAQTRGKSYATLFGGGHLSADGWPDINEFLAAVHAGQHHPQLMQAISTTGVPSDGGFSVPQQFVAGMLDASLESEIVRPRADVQPMTSSSKKVSGFDASDSSSTLYGGFTGQWTEEAGEITAQDPKMRLIELTAKKLALLTQVSNELIADGQGFEQGLEQTLI